MTETMITTPELTAFKPNCQQMLDCPYGGLADQKAWNKLMDYLSDQGLIVSQTIDENSQIK